MPHAGTTDYYVTDGTKSIPLSQLSPEAWNPVDEDETGGRRLSVRRAQQTVAIVFRAIDIRAKAVSQMPLMLERGGRDVTQDDDMQGLIAQLRSLFYLTEAALCLCYAAYWELATNAVGRNLTPFWLAPQSIRPDIDVTARRREDAIPRYYRTGANGGTLNPKQVVPFWGPSPWVEVGPDPTLAPAAVTLAAAGLLHYLDAYTAAFFSRGGIKMTLLSVEKNTPKDERDRLKLWWDRMVSGVAKAFRSVVVSSIVKPEVIGSDPKDAAAPALNKLAREDIAVGMGVPLALLMLSSPLAGGTADAERLNFYDFTVVPECTLIAGPANAQYLNRLDMRLTFQPQKLEVFQATETQKASAVGALVGGPILSVDEGRELIGRGPMPKAETPPPPTGDRDDPALEETDDQDDADELLAKARQIDLTKWRSAALKRLERGRSLDWRFASAAIPAAEQERISAALRSAASAEAVKAAFMGATP